MSRVVARRLIYLALLLALVLHNDLWYWNDASFVLGLPVGLLYHILFCLAVSLILGLLIRYAWPHASGE